jgi:hypothetical protein
MVLSEEDMSLKNPVTPPGIHLETPKPDDHPSSAVRDCLFNLFAATLHIGGRSSMRNLTTRHAVVTGTHLLTLFPNI